MIVIRIVFFCAKYLCSFRSHGVLCSTFNAVLIQTIGLILPVKLHLKHMFQALAQDKDLQEILEREYPRKFKPVVNGLERQRTEENGTDVKKTF